MGEGVILTDLYLKKLFARRFFVTFVTVELSASRRMEDEKGTEMGPVEQLLFS